MTYREIQKIFYTQGQFNGYMKFNEPLDKYSTISIGSTAPVFFTPAGVDDLRRVVVFLAENRVPYKVIGGCSNILFPDTELDAAVIDLRNGIFSSFERNGNIICAGGGMKLADLLGQCIDMDLGGMEGLVGIPGSVGGAICNNAGYKTVISENLLNVTLMDGQGNVSVLEKDKIEFGYRYSSVRGNDIILRAEFVLFNKDKDKIKNEMKVFFKDKHDKQPMGRKTLGCIFKNDLKSEFSAGKLIDMAGMKGKSVGDAEVSFKHANFIVNSGRATSSDVKTLIDQIRNKVLIEYSVELELEVEVL